MREKKYLIFFILLAVLVLLNLPYSVAWRIKTFSRDNLIPFQRMASTFSVKWGAFLSFVKNPGKPAEDKRKLIEEVGILRERLRSMDAVERENKALRKQLDFANITKRKMILCEIVARDEISGWWQIITLNKGLIDGVEEGKAVITVDGVVGKTIQVSRHTCDVLLITDPNCRVACKFSRTGSFGILRGGGMPFRQAVTLEMLFSPSPCRMDYVSREDEIWVRDEVVTSGLGGVFPEGMLVGYVKKVDIDPTGLYQRADIIPAADLSKLRYLFVVTQ
ncbi:MAG: rod shape-determining protein MreC [Kiritimatiellae bacterium]|nr:rod shape-determining protein MreC [Kiritimatiellia bacterium]MDD5521337.1 rod shape-determining protein MreC [Kiritimatiellia bacterium]